MRIFIHPVFTKYKIEIDSIILNKSNFYLIQGEGLSKKEDYEIFLKNNKICLFNKLVVLIEETNSKFSKPLPPRVSFFPYHGEHPDYPNK